MSSLAADRRPGLSSTDQGGGKRRNYNLRNNPELFLVRHALLSDVGECGGMRTFLYRCPTTGLNVQGLGADHDVPGDNVYEVVTCTFCRGAHVVNPVTGRVLGGNSESKAG